MADERHRGDEVEESRRQPGSPLGADPQDAEPLPGDPREAQEPQEPRSTHVAGGRGGADEAETTSERGVIDRIRESWERMRRSE